MAVKKKKRIEPNISKIIEPLFDENSTFDEISSGMKWYQEFSTIENSKKWLVEYLETIGYDRLEIAKVKSFSWNKSGIEIVNGEIVSLKFAGFVSRMFLRGLKKIPEQYADRMNKAINYVILKSSQNKKTKNIQEDQEENKLTLQDHMKFQVNNLCSEIEGAISDFYDSKFKSDINIYEWLKNKKIKGLIAKKIGDEFKPLLEEINHINSDEELKEAYSNFKPSGIKKYKNFVQSIVDDCERYSSNQNKQRKPRKKKPITLQKQITKINYKLEDSEYKIKSINPIDIFDSSVLWVFNVKYRKLGIYISEKPAGLYVKGSTVYGFDVEKSYQKTIRKPNEILNFIINEPKVSIRKKFDSIKSKKQSLSGRINGETILLRTIK